MDCKIMIKLYFVDERCNDSKIEKQESDNSWIKRDNVVKAAKNWVKLNMSDNKASRKYRIVTR